MIYWDRHEGHEGSTVVTKHCIDLLLMRLCERGSLQVNKIETVDSSCSLSVILCQQLRKRERDIFLLYV